MREKSIEAALTPDSPIGVFDSGIGGLTVVREIFSQLPSERVVYFADTAHVPYGGRPLEEVKGFALEITRFLISRGAKLVVMACNISSATALEQAREEHASTPVLGVVQPGARAAVEVAGNCRIGVLATVGTVNSGAYEREIRRLRPNTEVVQQSAPRYVPLVESDQVDSAEARAATEEYVRVFRELGVDTVILGCTHYPFMLPRLREALPSGVKLVDPSIETVHEIRRVLEARGHLSQRETPPAHEFYASGSPEQFEQNGAHFLGQPLGHVRQMVLDRQPVNQDEHPTAATPSSPRGKRLG